MRWKANGQRKGVGVRRMVFACRACPWSRCQYYHAKVENIDIGTTDRDKTSETETEETVCVYVVCHVRDDADAATRRRRKSRQRPGYVCMMKYHVSTFVFR